LPTCAEAAHTACASVLPVDLLSPCCVCPAIPVLRCLPLTCCGRASRALACEGVQARRRRVSCASPFA
jgi:hypothetical protein